MNHCRLSLFRLARRSAALLMAIGVGISGCHMPTPAPGGSTPADAQALATSQQSIQVQAPGKADMDCRKDGPWYLFVYHDYQITQTDATFRMTISGNGLFTVNRSGKVSGGPATGSGEMESQSYQQYSDCLFQGSFNYQANLTGTCSRGVMHLHVEELLGEGGAVTSTLTCSHSNPITFNFGFPMTQFDLTIPLEWSRGGGGVRISAGIVETGYKSWVVSNMPIPPIPTEPPTKP